MIFYPYIHIHYLFLNKSDAKPKYILLHFTLFIQEKHGTTKNPPNSSNTECIHRKKY